jgi:hypothetical protein
MFMMFMDFSCFFSHIFAYDFLLLWILSPQVLTQCMRTRDENGGLLDLRQCLQGLRRARPGERLAVEDVERAVECLAQHPG